MSTRGTNRARDGRERRERQAAKESTTQEHARSARMSKRAMEPSSQTPEALRAAKLARAQERLATLRDEYWAFIREQARTSVMGDSPDDARHAYAVANAMAAANRVRRAEMTVTRLSAPPTTPKAPQTAKTHKTHKTRGASAPRRTPSRRSDDVNLTPVARIEGHEINPVTPLDARFLRALYGDDQLRAALESYPMNRVQQAARSLGPKPKGINTKAALIDWITQTLPQRETYDDTLRAVGGERLPE